MIFYGTRSSNIKNGELRNVTCPHCQVNVSMNYSVFGKYAHIYWIPFFPIGKTNIIECRSCKASYDLATVDQSIKEKFKKEQEQNPAKTPLTHFSWLIVLGIGVAFAVYSSFKEGSDTEDFIKNPKVGDVYYYEMPKMTGHYTTFKITRIGKDSIFVMDNNMEIEGKDDVVNILDEKNYTYPDGYSKVEFKDLCKDLKTFYKITRE
jgi:hypothetical protein